MIVVKDNYLDEAHYRALHSAVTGEHFPWFFNSYKVGTSDKANLEAYQFIHNFYKFSQITNLASISSDFNILKPILTKLDYKSLVRIKLNLNPYSQKLIVGGHHQDQNFKCKGAIYYLNTNNGYTLFKKKDRKIESVGNRMVFFDATLHHLGTNSTNCKNRLVLNFNYF